MALTTVYGGISMFFDLFSKKDFCSICGREVAVKKLHPLDGGNICADCSSIIGLGERFDVKLTADEYRSFASDRVQIVKLRIASFVSANPGIMLDEGETCFFISLADIGKEKKRSITVKKGNKTERTTEEYFEKYPCRLLVTGKRILAIADQNGFEIKLAKLSDIRFGQDRVTFYSGSKAYLVFFAKKQAEKLHTLWNLLGAAGAADIDISVEALDSEITLTSDVEAYKEK